MAKKNRIDSITEEMKAAQAGPITPPKHVTLTKRQKIFFGDVIDEFARTEWTAHSLTLAANLARMLDALDEQQCKLEQEGYITIRENGTTVENPRSRVVKSITGDILSMRRSLSLHARARDGEPRDAATRRKGMKDAQSRPDDDDGLLYVVQ